MATLDIKSAGHFGSPVIHGKNPKLMQDDVALRVNANGFISLNKLTILNCGIALRHDNGKLKIRIFKLSRFTADAINTAGKLTIDFLNITDKLPFFYSRKYHKDSCLQAFNFKTEIVKDIVIHNIYARIKGKNKQFIMLSEGDTRYTGVFICRGGTADIKLSYEFAFVANQLDSSYVNVGKNGIKIKKVKPTGHHCFNVIIKAHKGQLIELDDFYVRRGAYRYAHSIMSPLRAKHLQKLLKIKEDGQWNIKSQYALELFARKKGKTLKRVGVVPINIYLKMLNGYIAHKKKAKELK